VPRLTTSPVVPDNVLAAAPLHGARLGGRIGLEKGPEDVAALVVAARNGGMADMAEPPVGSPRSRLTIAEVDPSPAAGSMLLSEPVYAGLSHFSGVRLSLN
jgi:hypothetical protein